MRRAERKLAVFFAYFQSSDHSGFAEDTEITFKNKVVPSDFTRRDICWIGLFKARDPLGLNNIDAN